MPAGTITLTNNSTAVSGSGTAFPTELKANDFLVAVVGGTTYTLGVKSVESATALTLTTTYGGPTTSGLAWTPIPNGTLVGITAQIAADTARAIRGLNYDKQNWQQVYSISGNITVTLPDGSTWTGPSWKYLSDNMATKVGGAVPIEQGGTGEITPAAALSKLGGLPISGGTSTGVLKSTSASYTITSSSGYAETGFQFPGSLLRLAYGFTENYGDYVFVTTVAGGTGTEKYFSMRQNGNFSTQGAISCVSLTQTSDEDKKDKITPIPDALSKLQHIDGVTFNWKESGLPSAGVIAQKLIEVLPEAVGSVFDDHAQYAQTEEVNEAGETVLVNKLIRPRDEAKRSYTVEYAGVVALLVAALKEEHHERMLLNARIEKLEIICSQSENLHNA